MDKRRTTMKKSSISSKKDFTQSKTVARPRVELVLNIKPIKVVDTTPSAFRKGCIPEEVPVKNRRSPRKASEKTTPVTIPLTTAVTIPLTTAVTTPVASPIKTYASIISSTLTGVGKRSGSIPSISSLPCLPSLPSVPNLTSQPNVKCKKVALELPSRITRKGVIYSLTTMRREPTAKPIPKSKGQRKATVSTCSSSNEESSAPIGYDSSPLLIGKHTSSHTLPTTEIVVPREHLMSAVPAAQVTSNTRETLTLPSSEINDINSDPELTSDIHDVSNPEAASPSTINVPIAKKKIRRSEVADSDYSGVCPLCFKTVTRVSSHLRRTCLSKGYSTTQRLRFYEQERQRLNKWKHALVSESYLLRNVTVGDNMKAYLEYNFVLDLIHNFGVLISHDVHSTIEQRSDNQSTINLENPRIPSNSTAFKRVKPGMTAFAVLNPGSAQQIALEQHRQVMKSPSSAVTTEYVDTRIGFVQEETMLEPGPSSLLDSTGPSLPCPVQRLSRCAPSPVAGPSADSSVLGVNFDDTEDPLFEVSFPNSPVQEKNSVDVCTPSTSKKRRVSSSSKESEDIPLSKLKRTVDNDSSAGSSLVVHSYNYTKAINKKMMQAGFYRKFDLESCTILKEFEEHLRTTLHVKSNFRKQTIANVNRILFHLDQKRENIDALANPAAIKAYFCNLPSELASSSKVNYIKSLHTFLSFCEQTDAITSMHPKFIEKLPSVRACINSIRAGLAKLTSKRKAAARAAQFRGEKITYSLSDIKDCVESLRSSSVHLLKSQCKLSKHDLFTINTYFNALFTLKNAQRPSVYVNMTLPEFSRPVKITMNNGITKFNVGITDHKTATHQLAYISLLESEYEEIQQYVSNVRPHLANASSPANVFLNRNGKPIFNPSTDLSRRLKCQGMPPITSRDARHAYETESALRLSASERSRLAQYLAHTHTTAESHYVDITNSLVKTSIEAMHKLQNIDTLESEKSSEDTSSIVPAETLREKAPKPAKKKQQATPSKTPNPVESKERFYKIILDKFMMTADKELPSNNELRRCIDATSGCESLTNEDIKRIRTRLEYKRLQLRAEEVVACFPRSQPQESQILNILERKGWLNQRTVDIITKTWKPCERRGQTTLQQQSTKEKIDSQQWHSCVIRDTGNPRLGLGLYSKRDITKGEIVCDYHGDLVSHEEGMRRYEQYKDDENHFLYFFSFQGKKYAIEGVKPCSCHNLPKEKLHGRMINHSKSNPNLIPKVEVFDGRPHLLMLAKHNIPLGTQLKFDYGVSKDKLSREDGANSFLDE